MWKVGAHVGSSRAGRRSGIGIAMRECALPRSAAPLATRTLLACIAAILEIDAETLPCAPEGSPWPRLAWWLAKSFR